MFVYRLKTFLSLALATLVATFVFCAVKLSNACKFSDVEGTRTFYLYTPTSQSQQTQTLDFSKLSAVRGESVRFPLNERSATSLAEEIVARYNATVCFTEEVDGVLSFYACTPNWNNALTLNGASVNLHIAVSKTECVVGSPIIFGGF